MFLNNSCKRSMSAMTEKKDVHGDERKTLYEFWEKLPPVTLLALSSKVLSSHPARPAILGILREGVVERFDEEPGEQVRHALKAEEIRARLKEEGIKMSKTSLYFHLGVLEENDLVKVVAKLLEGRHRVAYYGRTARGIIHRDPEKSLQDYRWRFMEAGRLAKAKRPDLDLGVVEGLAEEYLRIKQRRDAALTDWMAGNEALMSEHGIDFYAVFEFMKNLDAINPEYVQFLRTVAKRLGIDIWRVNQ
jgi:DNA-binding transcriptional ArsR family regulator